MKFANDTQHTRELKMLQRVRATGSLKVIYLGGFFFLLFLGDGWPRPSQNQERWSLLFFDMVARIYQATYSINVSCSKLGYKPDLKHQSRWFNLIDGFNSRTRERRRRKDLKIWPAFRGQTYRGVHNLPIDRSNTSDTRSRVSFARSFVRFNPYNDFPRHTISEAGLPIVGR